MCFDFVICQLRISVLWSVHFHGPKYSQVEIVNNALVTQISRIVSDEAFQILLVLSVKGSKSSC